MTLSYYYKIAAAANGESLADIHARAMAGGLAP